MKYKNNSSFLSFEKTREYARKLGIKTALEWRQIKHPENIYKHPNISFINKGWVDWNDFLGISKVNYLSFEETKNYARELGIKTCTEWAKIKHPSNIYKCPNMSFKNKGWTYWRDFLGTNDKYLSYEEVIKYARGLNFQSSYQWNLQKHPKNICKQPHMFFKNKGWTNWNDFLGKKGEKKKINYLSFEETREYARNLNINSSHHWKKIKHPENIFKRPDVSFKNKGWTNWDDFLGK